MFLCIADGISRSRSFDDKIIPYVILVLYEHNILLEGYTTIYIISKTHDYYDTALAYGIDKTLIYKRDMLDIECDLPESICEKFLTSKKSSYGGWINYHTSAGWRTHGLRLSVIGFAGVLYPSLRYVKSDGSAEHFYSCDFDRLLSELKDNEPTLLDMLFRVGTGRYKKKKCSWEELEQSVAELEGQHWLDPFVHFNVPSFYCSVDLRSDIKQKITINPVLRDYNFQRVKDPYTAFQDISMFMGGVIPRQVPETVTISDIDRLVGHGFDKKHSFRNTKG